MEHVKPPSPDLIALLELLASIEDALASIKDTQRAMQSAPLQMDTAAALSHVSQPLQAVSIPPPESVQPAPLHATEQRSSLAENVLVQWAVAQAVPWSYQQQVLDTLHKVRLSRLGVAVLVTSLLTGGFVTGLLPVPPELATRLRETYASLACPVKLPAQLPLPVPINPAQPTQ